MKNITGEARAVNWNQYKSSKPNKFSVVWASPCMGLTPLEISIVIPKAIRWAFVSLSSVLYWGSYVFSTFFSKKKNPEEFEQKPALLMPTHYTKKDNLEENVPTPQ